MIIPIISSALIQSKDDNHEKHYPALPLVVLVPGRHAVRRRGQSFYRNTSNPHPAPNLRMAMGLNGPVKMVSIGSDPDDKGALEYWFDEQGYITRYYVEPDYGAYEVSLDFIYQTEEDRITQIRIVDADGKLYGLQSFEYDAAGVLTRSRYDRYEWDLWDYDVIGAIETSVMLLYGSVLTPASL